MKQSARTARVEARGKAPKLMAGVEGFRLENHVCLVCLGRVISRPAADGSRLYRCACCGAEATGRSAAVICTCGFSIKGKKTALKCAANAQKSPEFPAEFVALQA